MTKEEFDKIPFRMRSHMSLRREYIASYATEDGQFGMEVHTPVLKHGDEFGKTRTYYRIGTKWYNSKEEFLEALEKVETKHK